MQLPSTLSSLNEWLLVGPMGPETPNNLSHLPTLAVDGGANFCAKIDAWIGDGDSFEKEINCSHIFRHFPQKNLSDLALALKLFKAKSVSLHLWGFVGGRGDHEILNYGEALHFLDSNLGSELIFYNQNGDIHSKCMSQGNWKIHRSGLFSVVSIKNIKIKLTGECLYPLNTETDLPPLSSLGLSNVGQGTVNLQCDGAVMIFFPESR